MEPDDIDDFIDDNLGRVKKVSDKLEKISSLQGLNCVVISLFLSNHCLSDIASKEMPSYQSTILINRLKVLEHAVLLQSKQIADLTHRVEDIAHQYYDQVAVCCH
jgi:uncharacterized membrane protein YgcG